jgi:hypothetical protein
MKQLSAIDYRSFPRPMKTDVDEWLMSEGLNKSDIFHMEWVGEEILVYQFIRNEHGKRYIDKTTGDPAQHCLHHKYNIAPPEGAFK